MAILVMPGVGRGGLEPSDFEDAPGEEGGEANDSEGYFGDGAREEVRKGEKGSVVRGGSCWDAG